MGRGTQHVLGLLPHSVGEKPQPGLGQDVPWRERLGSTYFGEITSATGRMIQIGNSHGVTDWHESSDGSLCGAAEELGRLLVKLRRLRQELAEALVESDKLADLGRVADAKWRQLVERRPELVTAPMSAHVPEQARINEIHDRRRMAEQQMRQALRDVARCLGELGVQYPRSKPVLEAIRALGPYVGLPQVDSAVRLLEGLQNDLCRQASTSCPEGSSEPLLDEEQVADMLGVSLAALRRWRREGRGPRFIKVERLVRYRREDVAAYVAHRPSGRGSRASALRE